MKVALCFVINYEHVLHKEEIWKEWIEPNKDIINVYFYYKDLRKIQSKWILEHTLPPHLIVETTYYHVVPAYLSLFDFAVRHDSANEWFCMLTDSCCPIVSPKRFRYLFFQHHKQSLFSWKEAWWNPQFTTRANLVKLPKELWLANDPWFVFTKLHVLKTLHFVQTQPTITQTVCSGKVANESLFAIILKLSGELDKKERIRRVTTHLMDWTRRINPTSPHVFREANETDLRFVETELERNLGAMFLRKVAPEFPDKVLRHFIYEHRQEQDSKLVIQKQPEIGFVVLLYGGGAMLVFVVLFLLFK